MNYDDAATLMCQTTSRFSGPKIPAEFSSPTNRHQPRVIRGETLCAAVESVALPRYTGRPARRTWRERVDGTGNRSTRRAAGVSSELQLGAPQGLSRALGRWVLGRNSAPMLPVPRRAGSARSRGVVAKSIDLLLQTYDPDTLRAVLTALARGRRD